MSVMIKASLRKVMVCAATMGVLAAYAPAHAVSLNEMSATARQNTVGESTLLAVGSVTPLTTDFSSSTEPSGEASASVALTEMRVTARGGDAVRHFDAISAFKEGFTLWNIAEGRALTASERSGLALSFDFSLSGAMTLPGVGGPAHSISMGYMAITTLGASALTQSGFSALVCGGSSCSQSGVPVLVPDAVNIVDFDFSQSFASPLSSTGQLFMSLQTLAGGGNTDLFFEMTGFRQTGGMVLPLALRFDDGSLINVTAVPEPATLGMMLAGLAAIGMARTRRARRQAD